MIDSHVGSGLVSAKKFLRDACMENRRNTIVINKKFQYQFSLLIAAGAVLLVNGFLIAQMLFPGNSQLSIPANVALGLGAVELILIVGIWYGSLRASHRVAGPVFVFTREISKLGRGDLTGDISLRDSDMFHIEGDLMNEGLTELRKKIHMAKNLATQLEHAHASGAEVGPLLQKLTSDLSSLKTEHEE